MTPRRLPQGHPPALPLRRPPPLARTTHPPTRCHLTGVPPHCNTTSHTYRDGLWRTPGLIIGRCDVGQAPWWLWLVQAWRRAPACSPSSHLALAVATVNSPRVQSAHDARIGTPPARRRRAPPCLALPGHPHLRGMGPVPVIYGLVMLPVVCVTNAAQYTTRHAKFQPRSGSVGRYLEPQVSFL